MATQVLEPPVVRSYLDPQSPHSEFFAQTSAQQLFGGASHGGASRVGGALLPALSSTAFRGIFRLAGRAQIAGTYRIGY